MPRRNASRGVALPLVLGIVMTMGVSVVSVWREVRLQTWSTRQDVLRQQNRQALMALLHDAQRAIQRGSPQFEDSPTSGCRAGVCSQADTASWTLAQWAAHAHEGARFGQDRGAEASPLAQAELSQARYWIERLPYDVTQRLRGGPEPLSPAWLYRVTAWLPATPQRTAMAVQALWFQDDTDPRLEAAAGQLVGLRWLLE